MDITNERIQKVCETLPISFYCKRRLNVGFSEFSPMSSYDPMKDEISISLKQIMQSLLNANVRSLGENEIDSLIRSNFYHEVSHAILTPKNLIEHWRVHTIDSNYNTCMHVMNIIEDERIETLLSSYYINVDFKRSLIMMNGLDAVHAEPQDAEQYLYKIVRYRTMGSAEVKSMLNKLIRSNRSLCRNSNFNDCGAYIGDVIDLWKKVKEEFEMIKKQEEEKKEKKEKKEQKDSISGSGNETLPEQNQSNEAVAEQSPEAGGAQTDIEAELREIESVAKEMNENADKTGVGTDAGRIMEEAMSKNEFADQDLYENLKRIIITNKNNAKRNGAAINCYSGVIDPRLTDREDKRFFVQKNRGGHYRQGSKLHITFVQDISGSYSDDEFPTNQLFYSLQHLEKECSEFSFDVITVNMFTQLLPKNRRCIKTSGGTKLGDNIFDLLKRTRRADAVNKTIILFDGSCDNERNFRAFNSKDCSIIYEYENARTVEMYCPNAKRYYVEDDFSGNLKRVALKVISQLL